MFQAYGGYRCVCCDETHPQFLAIDHIDGGGNAHRRAIGGTANLYNWLRKNNYPAGFQVLCHNCNFTKSKYGECPHKKERADFLSRLVGFSLTY